MNEYGSPAAEAGGGPGHSGAPLPPPQPNVLRQQAGVPAPVPVEAPAEAPPAAPRRPIWRSGLVQLGVIGLFVVGGIVFRDRLTGAASDLRVGDCFDEPANVTEVTDVQHRPCSESHDAEVIFVGNHPDQDAYPDLATFEQFAVDNCVPAFESYVGRDYETDTEFDFGFLYPSDESWRDSDLEVTCYAYRVDEQRLTKSVKAAGS